MGLQWRLLWLVWVIVVIMLLLVCCKPDIGVSPLHSSLQPVSVSKPTSILSIQPAPGTATVVGILKIEHTDQPMAGVELYLALHIGVDENTPIYSLEPSSAPHAVVENNGRFVFKDVPPGRYSIVVWNPFNSFLVRDPKTGLELVIDVRPNQIYDLGILFEPLP